MEKARWEIPVWLGIPGLAGLPTVAIPLGCSLGGIRSLDGLKRLRAAIGGS